MCLVSDKIKFCTCDVDSFENLPNYWLLYRFNHQKNLQCMGEPIMPYDFIQPNFQLNKNTLAIRLNELDVFDKVIAFKEKDQLEIVINNLMGDKLRMTFCFKYKKGKWVSEEYDSFELMNHYDEKNFGSLDQVEKI